jgi:hypothetical protein
VEEQIALEQHLDERTKVEEVIWSQVKEFYQTVGDQVSAGTEIS